MQARFGRDQVSLEGESRAFLRIADSGRRTTYQFCPLCGSTVAYSNEGAPEVVVIPLGAFIDPPPISPTRSYFERRRRPWIAILGEEVEYVDGDD